MSDTGRPKKNLKGEIIDLLETTEDRAMTLGMVTEEIDASRATVKSRLDSLSQDSLINNQQLGNATVYWRESLAKSEPSPKEIREILIENERPFMGTGELADALGYKSNPGVNHHLKHAKEKGKLNQTTIGGYKIWYLPELEDYVCTDNE